MVPKEDVLKPTFPGKTGDPFRDMCTMLGLINLSWAWAETSLAMTIELIEEKLGKIRGFPESPQSLKNKVQCFKNALKDVQALQYLKEDGTILAGSFLKLAPLRHNLTHGAARQVHNDFFQSVVFKVISRKYVAQEYIFDIDYALGLNSEIGKLSDNMTLFMQKVYHILNVK